MGDFNIANRHQFLWICSPILNNLGNIQNDTFNLKTKFIFNKSKVYGKHYKLVYVVEDGEIKKVIPWGSWRTSENGQGFLFISIPILSPILILKVICYARDLKTLIPDTQKSGQNSQK